MLPPYRLGNRNISETRDNPETRVVIAKVGIGVFVKRGGTKPDISSVKTFETGAF